MKNIFKKIFTIVFGVSALLAPVAAFAQTAFEVKTYPPTSISDHGAVLHGFVGNSNANSNVWFQWGDSGLNETSSARTVYSSSNFSAYIGNLETNKVYYYRAVAQRSDGDIVYGTQQSFKTSSVYTSTLPVPVNVQTRSAKNVTDSYATLEGYIDPQGVGDAKWWFEWGSTSSFGKTTSKLAVGSTAAKIVNASISGLQPNTHYYFRLVGESKGGMVNGNTFIFLTGSGSGTIPTTPTIPTQPIGPSPSAVTQNAIGITSDQATLSGIGLSNTTGATVLEGWFQWGKGSSLTDSTVPIYAGTATSTIYSQTLGGLAPKTTYSFRAMIRTSGGVGQGIIKTFTTGAATPGVVVPVTGPTAQTQKGTTTISETQTTTTQSATSTCACATTTSSSFGGLFVEGQFLPSNLLGWLLVIAVILMIVSLLHHIQNERVRKKEDEKRRKEMAEVRKAAQQKPAFKLPGQP